MNEQSQRDARDLERLLTETTIPSLFLGPLTIALSAAVPLRMLVLIKRGGPTDADYDRIRGTLKDLGERGCDLFFRGEKEGDTADRFEQTADAIAVVAFSPGGITLFGEHYEHSIKHKEQQ